jgi:hypothetical protein
MTRSHDIIERDGLTPLPLEELEVGRCVVDFGFTIYFGAEGEPFVLRIEGAFDVELDGVAHHLDPGKPEGLGPAFALLHKTVGQAEVGDDKVLELEFSNGAHMCVPPNDKYEAWQLSGPGGLLIICMPGGELAVWQSGGAT